MEEQQNIEKDKCKGDSYLDPEGPSPPINAKHSAFTVSGPWKGIKWYNEWLQSHVTDDGLKDAFRQACDVSLDDGLDLEQVYRDRYPYFFINKKIRKGIARHFVENIPNG
ncbi:uncharacterized protein N7484_010271 [Penicillium longicatenatum]|uniref:uncharacterized protein n=1 Tax=Penicillium longicatenatum TaxID=1561947 RepID=UPI002547273E|nr:uncharacterized protein N7484_010271 [Penicillium longicatenatum]KAJ5636958.1 hypothetical protein N7484_010271 [Penicillium longicatenatum]